MCVRMTMLMSCTCAFRRRRNNIRSVLHLIWELRPWMLVDTPFQLLPYLIIYFLFYAWATHKTIHFNSTTIQKNVINWKAFVRLENECHVNWTCYTTFFSRSKQRTEMMYFHYSHSSQIGFKLCPFMVSIIYFMYCRWNGVCIVTNNLIILF